MRKVLFLALLLAEGGGMIAAHHTMCGNLAIDRTLAVVNAGNAYFDTGFVLDSGKVLEVTFKRTVANYTGDVLVGHQGSGTQPDDHDFRLFFFSGHSGSMFGDHGSGRLCFRFSDIGADDWHTVVFPSGSKMEIDGVLRGKDDSSITDPGMKPYDMSDTVSDNTLKVFAKSSSGSSQRGAIRHIGVRDFASGRLLLDLWPDERGGFVDAVSRRLILPSKGEVSVVDWRTV